MEVFEAAKKAGQFRFIDLTGHCQPDAHTTLLKAYKKWDTVMMPIHAGNSDGILEKESLIVLAVSDSCKLRFSSSLPLQ